MELDLRRMSIERCLGRSGPCEVILSKYRLVILDEFSEDEWVDRGCLLFELVLDDRKYVFSAYSPYRLIEAIQAEVAASGVWSDSNVIALNDLSLDSIRNVCADIQRNGFAGFAHSPM